MFADFVMSQSAVLKQAPALPVHDLRSVLDTFIESGIVPPFHPDPTTITQTGLSTSPDTENLYDLLATVHDHSLAQTQVAALPTDLQQSDLKVLNRFYS